MILASLDAILYRLAMRRTLLTLCLAACSGEGGEDRLIPSTDSQFTALERPELAGECAETSQCNGSCVHSCVPVSREPTTCPADPVPPPERLLGAICICHEQVCKWL